MHKLLSTAAVSAMLGVSALVATPATAGDMTQLSAKQLDSVTAASRCCRPDLDRNNLARNIRNSVNTQFTDSNGNLNTSGKNAVGGQVVTN